jgi:pilus assembly protein Flp/PilA
VAEVARPGSLAGWLLRDESAASLVEYGLVVGLVSIAAIGALTVLRSKLIDVFNRISTALSST